MAVLGTASAGSPDRPREPARSRGVPVGAFRGSSVRTAIRAVTETTPSTPRHSCSMTGTGLLCSTVPVRVTRPSRTSAVTSRGSSPRVRCRRSSVISSRTASSRRRKIRSRSPRLTMPRSRSASPTTGSRLTSWVSMRRAASATVRSGRAHRGSGHQLLGPSPLGPGTLPRLGTRNGDPARRVGPVGTLAQQIGLGHHAHRTVELVHHGHGGDVVLLQQPDDLLERCVGPCPDDVPGHELPDCSVAHGASRGRDTRLAGTGPSLCAAVRPAGQVGYSTIPGRGRRPREPASAAGSSSGARRPAWPDANGRPRGHRGSGRRAASRSRASVQVSAPLFPEAWRRSRSAPGLPVLAVLPAVAATGEVPGRAARQADHGPHDEADQRDPQQGHEGDPGQPPFRCITVSTCACEVPTAPAPVFTVSPAGRGTQGLLGPAPGPPGISCRLPAGDGLSAGRTGPGAGSAGADERRTRGPKSRPEPRVRQSFPCRRHGAREK